MLALSAGNAGAAFDGGYAAVPYDAALEPTATCTWILRVHAHDPSGYTGLGACPMSQWDRAAGKGRLLFYRNVTDASQIVVGHSNTGGDVVSCATYSNTGEFTANTDHELAFVFDGSLVGVARGKLYVDGALTTQNLFGAWPAALSAPGAPISIGARKGDAAAYRPWNGWIWDVRIYGEALSSAQIAAAYADGDDPALPAPIARWKFPETSGNFTSAPGGYVATPTAVGAGRAPSRAIRGWLGGGVGESTAVMCVGDSMVVGAGSEAISGWRAECRNRLRSVHKKRLNFVGEFSNTAGSPAGFLDPEHCGLSGYQINSVILDDIREHIAAWMATYSPSAVVLFAGYNDIANGDLVLVAAQDMEDLARDCYAANPSVKTVICTLPRTGNAFDANVVLYNVELRALVTELQGEGKTCALAEIEFATSKNDVIATDNVHMHHVGNQRAAVVVADALASVL